MSRGERAELRGEGGERREDGAWRRTEIGGRMDNRGSGGKRVCC